MYSHPRAVKGYVQKHKKWDIVFVNTVGREVLTKYKNVIIVI